MSAVVASTTEARHLLVRLPEGTRLTQALGAVLRDEVVLAGWLRATGSVEDVELRTLDARTGTFGPPRRLEGYAQLLSLEGAIAFAGEEPVFGARVLCAREGALGLETFAGELVDAKVVAVEVLVTALDQIAGTPAAAPSEPATTTWAEAAHASEVAHKPAEPARPEPARPAPPRTAPAPQPAAPMTGSAPMPTRPAARPVAEEEDQAYPDANDVVEHFAFGRCEVLKSDGDRLHVRAKDGRIKEIALEMLKVTTLGPNHFKLDRKL